jgi:hypothetical protein
LEYDVSDLEAPSQGLCPRGVVAFLRTTNGMILHCSGSKKGYSSSWLSSGSPLTKERFEPVPTTTVFKTQSYQVADVLMGISNCLSAADIASISEIKLTFAAHIRVNGAESNWIAETEWLSFPEAVRRKISHKSDAIL